MIIALFRASLIAVIVPILLIFLNGCKKEESKPGSNYTYQIPEHKDDGWEVASLADVGIAVSTIEQIAGNIINDQYKGIHSMLIIRNGSLVFEEYFKGYNRDDLQHIFSITKSVSSSLIGIAIDQEFIRGVEDPVLAFFPEYHITDSIKQKLLLKHILTLSTGFEWDEKTYPYTDPRNSEYQMFQTDDWMQFVLQRPLSHNPGEIYNYNTGSVHLLSSVIKKSTHLFANEFAEQYLFEPLGITDYFWNTDNQGFPCTGATHGGLKMKARDVAKYGFLYLNHGKWNNTLVIPENWIKESVVPRVDIDQTEKIGYLWRLGQFDIGGNKKDYYLSVGFGGQTLLIMPELDLMLVFLCWNNATDADLLIPTVLILNSIVK